MKENSYEWHSTLIQEQYSAFDPTKIYASDLAPQELPQFQDQKILITGAGTGIGGGLVIEALRHGAKVIAAYYGLEQHIHDAVCNIDPKKSRSVLVECDLRNEKHISTLTENYLHDTDVVFFNAGITLSAPFLETDPQHLKHLFEVNVLSAFVLAQSSCRAMLKRSIDPKRGRRGHLVFFTSPHALGAMGCHSAYAASKLAIEGIAQQIAIESNKENWGIKVNSVRPGWVFTEEQVRVKERHMPHASREQIIAAVRNEAKSFAGYSVATPRDFAQAVLAHVATPGMHDQGSIWDLSGGLSGTFPSASVIAAKECPTYGKSFLDNCVTHKILT